VSELAKLAHAALDAVARHFSGTWERGEDPREVYVSIAGKRVAIAVAILDQRFVERPRLRFDRVALRLVRNLRSALGDAVPDGQSVILTVTAPIRLPGRTAAELEGKIRTCLGSKAAEIKDTIHGNGIRLRLVKHGLAAQSKVIGFVHNPDSDPGVLMDLTSALIDVLEPAPAGYSGERWLVLASEDRPSHIGTYRDICAQLSLPADFARILMVFAAGRVESLAEQKRDEDG
jgi:hypothetical protein